MSRETQSQPDNRILVMAASTRTGSINQALARSIADEIRRTETSVSIVDLADYPMPLYDADLESADGVPATVHDLAGPITAADVLIIVSPEYNGAFTPLLKNTIDWLTRVDTSILARLQVLLASASPGKGGGARGLAMVDTWMHNIGVAVAERTLLVGSAQLMPDGEIANLDSDALTAFALQATRLEPTA